MAKKRRRNPEAEYDRALQAFEDFHGTPPVYADEFNLPDPPEYAYVLGRAYAVSYVPERGSRKGEVYEHKWGDTGYHMLRHKPLLAVSADGRQVFLIRGRSAYVVNERGIVG